MKNLFLSTQPWFVSKRSMLRDHPNWSRKFSRAWPKISWPGWCQCCERRVILIKIWLHPSVSIHWKMTSDENWKKKSINNEAASWWNTKFLELPLKEKYRENWIFEIATEKLTWNDCVMLSPTWALSKQFFSSRREMIERYLQNISNQMNWHLFCLIMHEVR